MRAIKCRFRNGSALLVVLSLMAGSINAAPAPAKKAPPPPAEIVLRHDLGGSSAAVLSEVVLKFNEAQKDKALVRLETVIPGEPVHGLPTIALLDPTAAMAFFGTRPRMQSLDDVMRRARSPLAAASLLPMLADTVDDANGRLQALPLGMSLPVLYLNTGKLRAAGLNPEQSPPTWWDLQEVAGKLFDHGVTCPLTSSHFSWVHLENLAAQSGEPLVANQPKSEKVLANGQISVKHLALISSWQKSRYFHYFGSGREGDIRFLNGDCAMLTSASALYPAIRDSGMDVHVAPLPYHGDVYGERGTDLLPDGLSLWVLAGTAKNQDQLIARFVRFLLSPETQREWIKRSGFLPMTAAGLETLRQTGAFSEPMFPAIKARLTAPKPRSARIKSSAARERFRAIFGEELEPVWTADRPPKEALDLTVQRMDGAPGATPWRP